MATTNTSLTTNQKPNTNILLKNITTNTSIKQPNTLNKPPNTLNKPPNTLNKPPNTTTNKPPNTTTNKPPNTTTNKPPNTTTNTITNKPLNTTPNTPLTKPSNTPSNTPINTPKNGNINKNEISVNNTINGYQSNKNSNETIKTTKQEMVEYGSIITDNYLLLLGVSSALIICIILYFFSESFRVGRILDKMLLYQGFQRLSSINYIKMGQYRLGDMHISSAYNAAHSGYQMYDYTSKKMVLSVLQSGVRYLEFNVFNNVFGKNAYPVVSMGYKKGEWKMMISDTPLETIFEIISENAFKIHDGVDGVFTPDDPIFIGLNLNTNSNLSCLNLIAFLITKYFRNRLLPNQYSYQNSDDIGDISLELLMGKVVFFASDGFQGSGLEEIINYSWDNIDNNPNHSLQRIHYSTLKDPAFNERQLIKYNKTKMTIVIPHEEGDFFNTNYSPIKALECGCQFIAMEFQYIDNNMDMYITKFKKKTMLLKTNKLRKGKTGNTDNISDMEEDMEEEIEEDDKADAIVIASDAY